MHSLPLTKAGSRGGGMAAGSEAGGAVMPPSQQLAMYKERCERMEKEAKDAERRLRAKDEHAAEIQRALTAAQQRGGKTGENLAAEQAEKKALEQSLAEAKAELIELRAQINPLQARTDRAESALQVLQTQLDAVNHAQQTSASALERAQRELEVAQQQARRADEHAASLREEAQKREASLTERLQVLEAKSEQMQTEAVQVAGMLAASQAEGRMAEDALKKLAEQAESERATLTGLLETARSRNEELHDLQRQEQRARAEAEAGSATALAERKVLHELSARVQEQLLHERAGHAAVTAQLENERTETNARLRSQQDELVAQTARTSTLEGERRAMDERVLRLEAEVDALDKKCIEAAAESANLRTRGGTLEAELAAETAKVAALSEVKERMQAMMSQRDAAEEGRVKVQEQLAHALERLQNAEGGRRTAESNLKDARLQIDQGSQWEQKCTALEREKQRLLEQLSTASAEAKAVGEREQVLLHRIALRERLTNVDWSRGAEVINELRAETDATAGMRPVGSHSHGAALQHGAQGYSPTATPSGTTPVIHGGKAAGGLMTPTSAPSASPLTYGSAGRGAVVNGSGGYTGGLASQRAARWVPPSPATGA